MTRKVAAGAILLLLLHAAYAQWQRGVSSDSLSAANDSISILIPIVDSLEVLDSIHEAEYNRRDEAYRDSVAVWDARVASASSVVVVEDVRYDSIEAEMRQRADERMSTLLDDLTLAHDRALGAAGEALTVETRAKEASVSQAMMWRSLAEERRL